MLYTNIPMNTLETQMPAITKYIIASACYITRGSSQKLFIEFSDVMVHSINLSWPSYVYRPNTSGIEIYPQAIYDDEFSNINKIANTLWISYYSFYVLLVRKFAHTWSFPIIWIACEQAASSHIPHFISKRTNCRPEHVSEFYFA